MNKPVYLHLSILEISKIVMYEFYYGYGNRIIKNKLNYVIWIQTALYIHKNKKNLRGHWRIF